MYYIRYGTGYIYLDTHGDPSYLHIPVELTVKQVGKIYAELSKHTLKSCTLEKIK